MYNRSKFYIMKAHHLTSCGRKLNFKRILEDHPDSTIILAQRTVGGKQVPCTIVGCRADYKVNPGDVTSYTIDTGNGYTHNGERLDIEHVYSFKKGVAITHNGSSCSPHVPNDSRYTWVMK